MPSSAETSATLALVLPTSTTATFRTGFAISVHVKHRRQRHRDRLAVGFRLHDVAHVLPPAPHQGMARQRVQGMVAPPPEDSEQNVRLLVEMNGIIGDTGLLQ